MNNKKIFSTLTLRALAKRAQIDGGQYPDGKNILRYGQCIWNVAIELWPDLVEPLRASDVDPFNNDNNVNAFINALQEKAGK